MLVRFCLYGFLKNQRYFEPFLMLLLLDRGLGYFAIGLLVGFRDAAVNLLEIPSGAMADLFGRRRTMVMSLVAYVASFVIFAQARSLWLFFLAMFFYAIGDAFRSGTHKAMIFRWLILQGRANERTRVYGYTRSWSQMGSALSVVIASALVFASDAYDYVFHLAIVPYALGIVNLLGYPRELDGDGTRASAGEVWHHTWRAVRTAVTHADLRRLLLENMGLDGFFQAVKDYLQPVLKTWALAAAAAWGVGEGLGDAQKGALAVGPVYLALYLLAAAGSRQSHRFVDAAGGEDRAARWLWGIWTSVLIAMALAGMTGWTVVLALSFVGLHLLQNMWRPILMSRFDAYGEERQAATVLSIESQTRRLATLAVAPLLGLAMDHVGEGSYWPLGLTGLVVAAGYWATISGARRSAN